MPAFQLDITCPAVLRSRRVLSQGISYGVISTKEAVPEAQHRPSDAQLFQGQGI